MQNLVERRCLPEGNTETQMRALQAIVLERMPWARLCDEGSCVIDKRIYLGFVGLLAASMYTFSPQGRPSGIVDMKLGQASILLQDGFAQSTVFKTQSMYGYQPVTISTVSMELLQIYLRKVRPAALMAVALDTDPLFLKWKNRVPQACNLGRVLGSFFKIHGELHVTTNTLRAMVETYAETSYRTGQITLEERKAIEYCNGHSSAVVENYYLQHDRASDVTNARSVFSILSSPLSPIPVPPSSSSSSANSSDEPFIDIEPTPLPLPFSPSSWLVQDDLKHIDWGTRHPCYLKTKAVRVKWTTEEVDYIEAWCSSQTIEEHGRMTSKCFDAILEDPNAYPIFHKNHMLTPGRLRNGYDAYLKRKDPSHGL